MSCTYCLSTPSSKNYKMHLEKCKSYVEHARKVFSGDNMDISPPLKNTGWCCRYCSGMSFRDKDTKISHEELCKKKVLYARKIFNQASYEREIRDLVSTISSDSHFVKFTTWIKNYSNGDLVKKLSQGDLFADQIYKHMCNIFLKNINKNLYGQADRYIFVLKDEFNDMVY
ncbi:Hypothetical protein BRZCDTV_182 [Brazilian cedratvirus IHUMI]|uniref:Uncharacterized protein n=1 Tax=Brazilian cedratvirus IHUMI TaxID=2126980 RepID=A0A2R8FDP5_9VIRU|nr:Hypothetical protein BRZCDTV_182 [Brazilian cedratvirus IHUMI]